MKQQSLKNQRNYLENPRRSTEFDPDYRDDLGHFEETKTKQADAESADINFIMSRYEKTGQLPQMIRNEPSYGDFSDIHSFHEAMEIVGHANSQFYALDGTVRARFGNDPAQMLAFVSDPKNREEMVKLGLAVNTDLKNTPAEILKDIRENTKPQKAKPKPDSGESIDE